MSLITHEMKFSRGLIKLHVRHFIGVGARQ